MCTHHAQTHEGKPLNSFGLEEKAMDRAYTLKVGECAQGAMRCGMCARRGNLYLAGFAARTRPPMLTHADG